MSIDRRTWHNRIQTFKAFRYPSYRLFWSSMAISAGGQRLCQSTQNWLVLELTDSPFLLGVVGFCTQIPLLILSMFAGAVADRSDKRYLLAYTQIGYGVAVFSLAALALTGVITWQFVAIAALIVGVSSAFWYPIRQAIVPEIVDHNDVMNAVALNSAGFYISQAISAIAMGWLVAQIGIGGSFGISGGIFMISLALLLMMQFTTKPATIAQRMIWREVVDAFRYTRHHSVVLVLIVMVGVHSILGTGALVTLMPVFARDILNVGVIGMGWLLSAQSWGSFLGTIVLASLGSFKQKGKLLIGALLCLGFALIAFAISRHYAFSLGLLVIYGAASALFMSTLITCLQLSVPDELRGRIMGLYFLTSMGLATLGPLQAGWIADVLGAPFAITISGAINCVLAVVVVIKSASVRQLY